MPAVRAQSAGVVSVDLGIGVAGPGEQASVPITISMTDAVQVGRIFFEISLPKKHASFISVVKGPAAAAADISVRTELQQKGEENTLQVELLSSRPIPPGEFLEINFGVSKTAQPNDEFRLRNLRQEVRTVAGETVTSRGADGSITVVGDAVFSCFFYMH